MIEPDNHTAIVDRLGGTWVRVDDMPGQYGSWWPLLDEPSRDAHARGGIGTARAWDQVEEYGEFTPASAERTAMALARIQRAMAS